MTEKLVIVGNGMAASRLLNDLVKTDPNRFEVFVFDQEPHGSYNRIMLSPVLAKEMDAQDILLNTPEWYSQNQIHLHANDPVVALDTQAQVATSASGLSIQYDKLVFATGSEPAVPGNLRDNPLSGVYTFRNMGDVANIQKAADGGKNAVVVGGGLLGLEAAYGLSKQGIKVTVVHKGEWLLNRQLDQHAATLLAQELESRNIALALDTEISEMHGNSEQALTQVTLANGQQLDADLAVIAIGIVPNSELAASAGLDCERGIVVDQFLTTSAPNIFALGECCQFEKQTFGLVAPIWDQSETLAHHLCERDPEHYFVRPTATKLKVSGINLFSAGEFLSAEGLEEVVFYDHKLSTYKKLLIKNNQLVGAVLYGAVSDGNWYFDLIQEKTDITAMRDYLIFGKDIAELKAEHYSPTRPSAPQESEQHDKRTNP
ncbi:MAG: NAD(P)/FAD-dependent oxidoreductase [Pontibacterium sp.]